MRTERAWPVSEAMDWAIGVATHCTKIGVCSLLEVQSGWGFGTMEFYDFPFSRECHHPS